MTVLPRRSSRQTTTEKCSLPETQKRSLRQARCPLASNHSQPRGEAGLLQNHSPGQSSWVLWGVWSATWERAGLPGSSPETGRGMLEGQRVPCGGWAHGTTSPMRAKPGGGGSRRGLPCLMLEGLPRGGEHLRAGGGAPTAPQSVRSSENRRSPRGFALAHVRSWWQGLAGAVGWWDPQRRPGSAGSRRPVPASGASCWAEHHPPHQSADAQEGPPCAALWAPGPLQGTDLELPF